MVKRRFSTTSGSFKMVKLPLWLYEQLDRLADVVQEHPKLYKRELQEPPNKCPLCGTQDWRETESRLYRYLQCRKCRFVQRDLRVGFGYKAIDIVSLGALLVAKRTGKRA